MFARSTDELLALFIQACQQPADLTDQTAVSLPADPTALSCDPSGALVTVGGATSQLVSVTAADLSSAVVVSPGGPVIMPARTRTFGQLAPVGLAEGPDVEISTVLIEPTGFTTAGPDQLYAPAGFHPDPDATYFSVEPGIWTVSSEGTTWTITEIR